MVNAVTNWRIGGSDATPVSRSAADALAVGDSGAIITTTDASDANMTVNGPIPAGWNCAVIQGGLGKVTVVAGDGITLVNADASFQTAKRWAALSLFADAPNHIVVGGYTA